MDLKWAQNDNLRCVHAADVGEIQIDVIVGRPADQVLTALNVFKNHKVSEIRRRVGVLKNQYSDLGTLRRV